MKKLLSEEHDAISKKFKELNRESDLYYKELELQWEKFNAQHATAELSFCQEHNLKKLDLELKKAEKNTLSWQIKLVHLQIVLKDMDQAAQTSTSDGSMLSPGLFSLPPSG
ncbi:hypothetical protein V8B97DRAFT_1915463 [Scleroderma yunnanense]